MGRRETLTQEAADAIYSADCLIGARRLISSFEDAKAEKYTMITAGQIAQTIKDNPQYEKVAVLMSGDIGFYSGAKSLISELDDCDVKCICGIGSLQYLCAKLLTSWDDAKVISLHGREENLCAAVMTNNKTFVLTGGNHTIATICSELCRYDLSDVLVSVGENLSYENERIVTAKAAALSDTHFDNLSVMLIINPTPLKKEYDVPGLPDDAFLRAEVPMTKSEIRSVSISKLRLKQTDVVYDIGAGTGSVSVEAALVCTKGTVFAIEKNKQAIDLIQRNSKKFGTKNMRVIVGLAPEALSDLPIPHKAFIGGSSGNMLEIIGALLKKNPHIRIVVNAIALETLSETLRVFEQYQLKDVDIIQLNVSKAKSVGSYHMMGAHNPIYILSGEGNTL